MKVFLLLLCICGIERFDRPGYHGYIVEGALTSREFESLKEQPLAELSENHTFEYVLRERTPRGKKEYTITLPCSQVITKDDCITFFSEIRLNKNVTIVAVYLRQADGDVIHGAMPLLKLDAAEALHMKLSLVREKHAVNNDSQFD